MREPAGFDEFVVAHSPGLVRSASLLTGDVGQAEDLVQTALTKAWQRWDRIEPGPAGVAYVRRIVVSTFLSWRRRRWYGEIPSDRVPDSAAPGDSSSGVDTRLAVLAALRSLPARQRAVLVLRFFDDLSEQETAEVLGCSVGTVKSQASKAKAALRTSSTLSSLFLEEVGHDPRR